ncbi:hypothetical protein NX059_008937 [Plenodomus lindquistii]|nr:hypothetical protein NX059_008937 [Plenodomus lindquistii]
MRTTLGIKDISLESQWLCFLEEPAPPPEPKESRCACSDDISPLLIPEDMGRPASIRADKYRKDPKGYPSLFYRAWDPSWNGKFRKVKIINELGLARTPHEHKKVKSHVKRAEVCAQRLVGPNGIVTTRELSGSDFQERTMVMTVERKLD